MRTTLACVAGCAFLFVAGPVALVHCSGSSTSGTSNLDAGHGSSGGNGTSSGATSSSSGGLGDDSGGTSSSSGGGGSSGGDEGGTSSGATEGGASSGGEGGTSSSSGAGTPVPEGGAPSDPNSVSCGSATCNTTTTYCCIQGDGGACTPYNSGACASNIKVSCNEAADCTSGVCCQPLAYGTHTTSCLPSCPGPGAGTLGDFQLCRTDAECGSADAGAGSQKCVVQMCSAAAGQPQNVKVEACAYYNIGGGPGNPGGWGALPGCTAN